MENNKNEKNDLTKILKNSVTKIKTQVGKINKKFTTFLNRKSTNETTNLENDLNNENSNTKDFSAKGAISRTSTLALDLFRKATKTNRKNFDFAKLEKSVKYDLIRGKERKIVGEIEDLVLYFKNPARPKDRNLVIRGASLKLYEGEVHAIIGESGSGKSVITSAMYGLAGDNAVNHSGKILLFNNEVQNFSFREWEYSAYRGKVISAVFQNPMSTLNPTMKIGLQIIEGMLINGIVKTRKEAYQKALYFLDLTKISNAKAVMKMYPHELSGGMLQRVVIAAIVSLQPKILVMDEPTTALDPTVQALVLDVIRDLQKKLKISIIFITHDLGVVASIADRISIMYAGQIVESGTRGEILGNPLHPYTWGLISSMPDVNMGHRLSTIRGFVPSSLNSIKGDAFAIRSDYALDVDFDLEPPAVHFSETHFVHSWLYNEKAPQFVPPQLIQRKWAEWQMKQEEKAKHEKNHAHDPKNLHAHNTHKQGEKNA